MLQFVADCRFVVDLLWILLHSYCTTSPQQILQQTEFGLKPVARLDVLRTLLPNLCIRRLYCPSIVTVAVEIIILINNNNEIIKIISFSEAENLLLLQIYC